MKLKSLSAIVSTLVCSTTFSLSAQAGLPEKTACVTLQGNGERFPALAGQVQSLLERNIEPKAIYGGSSGSGMAALVGAILDNESLNNTHVLLDGEALSKAEKAARILAASSEPNGTIIALPAVNQLGNTIRSALAFLGAEFIADAFIGYPDQALSLIESSTGQIALLVEFFGRADFTQALHTESLAERQELVMQQWIEFGDLLYVTPREFIRALVTAPTDSRWTERSEAIKKRYFDLYYSETTQASNSPDNARERYNRILNRWKFVINIVSDEQWEKIFLNTIANLDGLPFLSYTAEILSKPFYLPNGEKIIDTYHGRSGFAVPSTSIIHTTARIAAPDFWGTIVEKEGLENFYQVYYSNATLANDLLSARETNSFFEASFIQYFNDESGSVEPLIDNDKFLVISEPSLSDAIKASISEPNAFRRDPIAMTETDLANNNVMLDQNESLITFGGWMESANATTMMALEACQNVDYFVEVSNMSDGLFQFQLKATRAVIEGAQGAIDNNIGGGKEDDESTKFVNKLWQAFEYGREQAGSDRYVHLSFDWDNASGEEGEIGEALNVAFDKNRTALFLLSYQSAFEELSGDIYNRFLIPASPEVIGADLMSIPLKDIKDPSAIDQAVEEVMGQN